MSSTMTDVSVTILAPSQIKNTIRLMTTTNIALFIWGSPGISKSATAMQVATEKGVAFVDVRLSMLAPTDVIGMPYRVEENGETTGVAFTPPKILPRDLELEKVKKIDAIPTRISFATLNPKGSNGIHYVTNPVITAVALNRPGTPDADKLTAEIVSQSLTGFIVQLVNSDGEIVEGSVHYTVTGEAKAIVAFEELNSAPLATQQAAYQFILDRRAGEYIVPEGVRLIAMGNRQTDKGLTYNMPTPLANRFVHVEMKVSFEDWQEWAIGAMVHPHVVGYLSQFKLELNQFNPLSASRGFPTPRSWVFVSDILNAYENGQQDLSIAELDALICGAIGDGTGTKFSAYRKLADKLPKVEDILSGEVKHLPDEDKNKVALAYSITTSLCYELRIENEKLVAAGLHAMSEDKARVVWYKGFNNAIEFWMANFQPEVNVMGLRTVLTIHNLPVKNRKALPALTEFTKQYGEFIK